MLDTSVPINTFLCIPKLNKRLRPFPLGLVNLGHQRLLILNADPTLSTCHTNQLSDLTSFLNLAFIFCNLEGKMKVYLFLSFICYIYQSTSTKIKPKVKKDILTFGYRINYKYEGMLAHSFHRFYVVTKFILPSVGNLKFPMLNYDNTCAYLDSKMPITLKQGSLC